MQYQVCSKCILDTSVPDISFDHDGVCNYCHYYPELEQRFLVPRESREKMLSEKLDIIRAAGRGNKYDCILGVSGGVDSTYVAYLLREYGMRPLAVHFDSGWNSEIAVKNIERALGILNIDLYTLVAPWKEMRDLQLSYLRASVINADVPTDHGFVATLFSQAYKNKIKYFVSGHNVQTEGILPEKWVFDSRDLVNLRSIQSHFGSVNLREFPQLSIWRQLYYRKVKKIENFRILRYFDYVHADAKALITNKLGWVDYGGKHHESLFTRFFQGYYLVKKFGVDKRRTHLSNLIMSGQLTREQALLEISKPPYDEGLAREDIKFVCKKLQISDSEFELIMAAKPRSHDEFDTFKRHYRFLLKFNEILGK